VYEAQAALTIQFVPLETQFWTPIHAADDVPFGISAQVLVLHEGKAVSVATTQKQAPSVPPALLQAASVVYELQAPLTMQLVPSVEQVFNLEAHSYSVVNAISLHY
jgi:hypothetical protein